jgi:hypothetical protein
MSSHASGKVCICSTIGRGVPELHGPLTEHTPQPATEAEFGQLFYAAHDQLLARDRELLALGKWAIELLAHTGGSDAAANLSRLADIRRDSRVHELQASLAEQTAWAQRSAEEIVKRDKIIRELYAAPIWPALKGTARRALGRLANQTPWTRRSADWLAQRLGNMRAPGPGEAKGNPRQPGP